MDNQMQNQIPLDKVEIRRWGSEGLMLVIPKGICQPRNFKVGDWLQALIDADPTSTRFSFEPTSPPKSNSVQLENPSVDNSGAKT